jgi:hypothetical protein
VSADEKAEVRGDVGVQNFECVKVELVSYVHSSVLMSLHKPATHLKKDDLSYSSFQFSFVKRRPTLSWHVTKESRKTVFFVYFLIYCTPRVYI